MINSGECLQHVAYYDSPVGTLKIGATAEYICNLVFTDDKPAQVTPPSSPLLNRCIQQLDEYFNHQRQDFDLPLDPAGTPFQKTVWKELIRVPYGKTASYSEIARRIGKPKAARAIGGANNKNPIAIIIPCHRIIGANGNLIGYGGGMWRKKWLLEHEQNVHNVTGG